MIDVRNPPININYQDSKMCLNTAFHMACANGHLKIVQILLSCDGIVHGAPVLDPNIQNETGNTALHYAALNGRKEVVELLLSKKRK